MSQRDSSVSRDRDGRTYAGDDFECRQTCLGQRLSLFASSTENEGITCLLTLRPVSLALSFRLEAG